MIKEILVTTLLVIIFGSVLTVEAQQSDVKLSAHISLHHSIFGVLDKSTKSQFKFDDKSFFSFEMVNEASEDVGIVIGQQWRYLRPRLERNGKVIPYKKEMQDLLKEGNPLYSPVIFITLKPKIPYDTDNIFLDYWYDKPESGHYRISIDRIWKEKSFPSNSVDFDIIS